ncbi:MAG: M48 family metalloprotease [Planctomycetia bacterium]|nr:M48 family metalloprotease [Planctomycetia bacterium]
MQLMLILAVLGTLLSAEAAPAVAVADPGRRVLLCVVYMAAVVLLARVVAGVTALALKRDFSRRARVLQWYDRLRRLQTTAWLVGVAAIIFGLGWPQIIRQNWHLGGSILLADLLLLLPVLGPLVLSWWAFTLVDQTIDARLAELEGVNAVSRTRLASIVMQCRHQLGPVLAPLCIVLAVRDLATWLKPEWTHGSLGWGIDTLPLLALVIGFPWLLRYLWRTEPLPPGPLRTQLRAVEQRLGVRTRDILIWRTDETVCNAAVAGFVPMLRYVFLSDGLLSRLSTEQIAAVYAHELGHLRHRHMTLRLLAVVLPVVLWQAAAVSFPDVLSRSSLMVAQWGIAPAVQASVATLLAAGLYAALVFAWYCRVLEQEADLCGCLAVDPAGSLTSRGTEQFIDALSAVTVLSGGGGRRAVQGWLHPTLSHRAAFVRHMADDPAERDRFGRRTRRLARVLVALVVIAACWPLLVTALRAGGL